jgi:hypothetical protein
LLEWHGEIYVPASSPMLRLQLRGTLTDGDAVLVIKGPIYGDYLRWCARWAVFLGQLIAAKARGV